LLSNAVLWDKIHKIGYWLGRSSNFTGPIESRHFINHVKQSRKTLKLLPLSRISKYSFFFFDLGDIMPGKEIIIVFSFLRIKWHHLWCHFYMSHKAASCGVIYHHQYYFFRRNYKPNFIMISFYSTMTHFAPLWLTLLHNDSLKYSFRFFYILLLYFGLWENCLCKPRI
jgi:hypothetical protein